MKTHIQISTPIIILGPTASGKTKVAVELAKKLNGSIISADSRQVYKRLNLGTGKDLHEYEDIPYYLIDLIEPGEKYHVSRFIVDAKSALTHVEAQQRQPIICGGTGLYIQACVQGFPYSDVPVDEDLRKMLESKTRADLSQLLLKIPKPENFSPDFSTSKRMIRAIEICEWIQSHPEYTSQQPICPNAKIIGLLPNLAKRREDISKRLQQRIEQGLIQETENLLAGGLQSEQLIYYGLEYKYTTLYVTGQLNYESFVSKLETEIHRYAKRQLTYFRKMEKDGLKIHWISTENQTLDDLTASIISTL